MTTIIQMMEYQQPQPPQVCIRTNIDCREYLRTGKCKFGAQCKFNHPPVNCRDYLRTGKCKYGNQCKYNHPPWVQHGGGIKERINPYKPLYPLRPTEPPCGYFLRYGNCKFGQTCKFHHPPTALNANDNDYVLAQRPTEPDCIFFLKNGHCKFGSSCKFHHPLSVLGIINDMPSRSTQQQQQYNHMNVNRNDQFTYNTMGVNNYSATSIPFQIPESTNSTILLPFQTVYQEKESVRYIVRNALSAQQNSSSMPNNTTPGYEMQRVEPSSPYSNVGKYDEAQYKVSYSTNNNYGSSQDSHRAGNPGESYYMGNNISRSVEQPMQQRLLQNDDWSRSSNLSSFNDELQVKYKKMPSNDWKSYSSVESESHTLPNSYPPKSQNSAPLYRSGSLDSKSLGNGLPQLRSLDQNHFDDASSSSPIKLNSGSKDIFTEGYRFLQTNQKMSPKSNGSNSQTTFDNDDDEALSKMTSTILNLIDTPSGSGDNDIQVLGSSPSRLYEGNRSSPTGIHQQESDYSPQKQTYYNPYNSQQPFFSSSKILEKQSHHLVKE